MILNNTRNRARLSSQVCICQGGHKFPPAEGGPQRKAAMETRAKAKIAERNQKTACKGIEGTEKSEGRPVTLTVIREREREREKPQTERGTGNDDFTLRWSLGFSGLATLRRRSPGPQLCSLTSRSTPPPPPQPPGGSSGVVEAVPVRGGSRVLRSAPGRKPLRIAAGSGSVSGGGKLGEG